MEVLTDIQALDYRRTRLSSLKAPLLNLIATARVSSLSPITTGRFAWVFLNKQVTLAQGKHPYAFLPSWLIHRTTSCVFVHKIRW